MYEGDCPCFRASESPRELIKNLIFGPPTSEILNLEWGKEFIFRNSLANP